MSTNGGGCNPKCPSTSKKESPSGRSRTRTTTRTNVASVSRSPLYVDGATLNAMMANLETFGHGLGQFTPRRGTDRYGTGRVPYPTHSSTPQGLLPGQHETFGPQMDYNLSWIPGAGVDSEIADRTPPLPDDTNKFLLTNEELAADVVDESIDSKRRESIIEWFDRSVEQELEKRKDKDHSIIKKSPCAEKIEAAAAAADTSPKSPNAMRGLAEATASGVEIIGELLREKDADLIDAVENLAAAEAMCNFAGAVEAAEEACKSVPLECAEEAAAAGVRGYQREITNMVQQTIPGEHPIEVVGYVGVTRPKNPRKPTH
ncbi:uncharacterized protein LOC123310522 [Coccinella septempunctata]|uniref:uncharacterized protein LOC123310522 n=1 Tax=Coccinella septempunctata TaxID=41139 RepID=UPI001D089F04|nr:uncharacterized protein LOC123310522 [Coccinella septempunctata]